MSKPYIVTVDDEPQVLSAINRDLRSHYQGDYRIVRAGSGAEALETIKQLKQRGEAVALLLSDQRMPVMSGTEFLAEAMGFYPEARKVLLTAYADTEAAIASINSIGLDHYLMKPWNPPEQNLYPVLDDLLSQWHRTVPLPYDGIRVAGTLWSANSHNVKDFLARNRIPYQWLDVEVSEEAQKLVESTLAGRSYQLPVVFMPDGEVMVNPDFTTLADKVGLQTQAKAPYYDLIVVGAGPAGLAAAVYGASEGLKTLVVEKEATGGQAGQSSRIENYLGFPKGLSGADLASRATIQATRLGAEILTAQEVVSVRVEDPYRIITLGDGSELSCKALVIACGVSVRQLDLPGIEKITGAGVYYGAAMTEAAHYKDQHVFVIGGANSAGQGAMFFSRYARKVTMLVRSNLEKSMSQYLIDQIAGTPNIEVMTRTEVVALHGEKMLEAITIQNKDTDETQKLPAAAVFIFIGARAYTEFVNDLVACNKVGFVLTGSDLAKIDEPDKRWLLSRDPLLYETNVSGIFAVGDVRNNSVKRVASAVGEGAVCVAMVHQYLRTV